MSELNAFIIKSQDQKKPIAISPFWGRRWTIFEIGFINTNKKIKRLGISTYLRKLFVSFKPAGYELKMTFNGVYKS